MKVQWQAQNFLKYLLSIVDQYSHPSKTGSPGIVNFLSGTVQGTGTLHRVSSIEINERLGQLFSILDIPAFVGRI